MKIAFIALLLAACGPSSHSDLPDLEAPLDLWAPRDDAGKETCAAWEPILSSFIPTPQQPRYACPDAVCIAEQTLMACYTEAQNNFCSPSCGQGPPGACGNCLDMQCKSQIAACTW